MKNQKVCAAVIEIDKTIADISEREQRAKSHTEARMHKLGARAGKERWHRLYMDILYSQEALYSPDLVSLDAPITGAADTLTWLHQREGYTIILRTCRPHWMESATAAWLKRHSIPYDQLQCKNFADRTERFTRNAHWKAQGVCKAAQDYDLILYVDTDKRSIEAVEQVNFANVFTAGSLIGLQLPVLPPETSKTFYWRKAGSDYALIDSRTNRIQLRLTTQERAQHFTDLWNHVLGPPRHCGNCGREVPESEYMFGHSYYLALCFACSCANEGD